MKDHQLSMTGVSGFMLRLWDHLHGHHHGHVNCKAEAEARARAIRLSAGFRDTNDVLLLKVHTSDLKTLGYDSWDAYFAAELSNMPSLSAEGIAEWRDALAEAGIDAGTIARVVGDYSR